VDNALRCAPILSDARELLPHKRAAALDQVKNVGIGSYHQPYGELAQDAVTMGVDFALVAPDQTT
jgi:hypothetical protein